jgi:hypothetical protein
MAGRRFAAPAAAAALKETQHGPRLICMYSHQPSECATTVQFGWFGQHQHGVERRTKPNNDVAACEWSGEIIRTGWALVSQPSCRREDDTMYVWRGACKVWGVR